MKSAGDLLIDAVDRWASHVAGCSVEPCGTCDVALNQFRLAHKVWLNSRHKAASDAPERQLLKRLVIGWDADQDEKFSEAMRDARELLGLKLAEDADHVLTQLQRQHDADRDDDDADQETALLSAPYTRLWRCEGVAGGAPCLRTTGILVTFVASRFAAGESPRAIADDYGVPEANVLEAIRFVIDVKGQRLTSKGAAARIALRPADHEAPTMSAPYCPFCCWWISITSLTAPRPVFCPTCSGRLVAR